MTLLYSDVEEELRFSVRQLLAARAPHAAILRPITQTLKRR